MKILLINNDLMERSVIQQVLQRNGHDLIVTESSDNAMTRLREGDIRFVIADRTGTDIEEKQFIRTLREANPPHYIYILLITSNVQETDIASPQAGPDDHIRKPVVTAELKSRVAIGERFLKLGDGLLKAKDALTNPEPETQAHVMNEKVFLAYSHGELERARRAQTSVSLIAFEVDMLDAIRQQHGDVIANDVLIVASQAIREKSRPYDGVGQMENNSFLAILPGVIGHDAEKIAERILKSLINTEISMLDGTHLHVSLSAGIVSVTRVTTHTEVPTLVERAMDSLAIARRTEGNQLNTIFM